MPRPRRKSPLTRTTYGASHVLQLLLGHDFFNDAFGADLDAMRAAWPLLKPSVYAELARRLALDRTRRIKPWAFWQFDAPGKPQDGETERAALARLGLPLTPEME